ncbi:hypothetical protein J5U23_01435 [Saccharolobus shibatae B12]|uniref:Glycosyltransferase n=1 Tax=Saccharolobus shibatae (strain ATCC 51178 / DSM 5389 / JCM 8931 / NBRC 15437 / B12) TaxID=523848 RepID=A0A8F5BNL1_SACSH|nr:glycosyltransferase family 4 protein [Saccharolobus shibatae]QXJ28566.1 hypothetical protein J5U23_01435 [Saccharolobus shibatae B12]
MKIALISAKYDFDDISKVTGIGRYARMVYQGLKRKGIDVHTYSFFDYSSVSSFLISTINGFFYNYSNYDIIHFLSPKPFIPLRKGKAVWITTAHDLFFLRYKESRGNLLTARFYMRSLLNSDVIVAVSSLVKEEIERTDYEGKIFVVNPGIDERFFIMPKREKNNNFIKLGYIGRLDHERKNVIRGIRVFKKIKDKNIIFELWGDYNMKSDIFKQILRESKNDSRIKIMGPAPDDKLMEIYDSFDFLFLPTKKEGFGFPIVEAYARGVPVIVFNDAKIPQEVCKYCIRIEDELPNLRELNIDTYTIREYAKNFSLDRMIEKLFEIYNKLINN